MSGIKEKATITQEEDKKTIELNKKEAEIAEYNAVKSICLNCENAFVQRYIDNPHNPDPMIVVCKIKSQMTQGLQSFYWSDNNVECYDDKWARKTLDCSDFKEKEKT